MTFLFFRAFEDEAKARLGVVECAKHDLVQPFTVLQEKEGELGVSESTVWVHLLILTPIQIQFYPVSKVGEPQKSYFCVN